MKKRYLFPLITLLILSSCSNKKLVYSYNIDPFGYNEQDKYFPCDILENGDIVRSNKLLYPFNTFIYIKSHIYESEKSEYESVVLKAKEEIVRLSCLFDRHNYYVDKDNNLLRNLAYLNDNYGSSSYIELEKETYDLLKTGYELTLITEGKFNIFIGELTSLWDGYLKEGEDLPSQEDILNAKNNVPSLEELPYLIEFNDEEKSVKFNRLDNKKISITFGGIAKGRMTDLLYPILDDKRSIISGGQSSIATYGDSFYDAWTVAINNPKYNDSKHYLTIDLKGKFSLSTSGDNQNYRIHDGVRYHHIINPFTGYPESYYRSCSLIGSNGTYLDALTTSLMLTPLNEVESFLNKIESVSKDNYNFVLINEDNNEITAYVNEELNGLVETNEDTEMKIAFF